MSILEFNTRVLEEQSGLAIFAYKLTRHQEDARDLLQETILKAMMNRNKFAERTNLRSWLYTIMRNTFINTYRRKRVVSGVFDFSTEGWKLSAEKQSQHNSPEKILIGKELSEGIFNLEEEVRTPFEMHQHGYKYKEIAEELELPIGTVKSRIFNARKQLMHQFRDYRPAS
jgi:RNA polymerase sigma factor (sigma-70 family)